MAKFITIDLPQDYWFENPVVTREIEQHELAALAIENDPVADSDSNDSLTLVELAKETLILTHDEMVAHEIAYTEGSWFNRMKVMDITSYEFPEVTNEL